jgi:hypothetical protein
MPDLLFLPVYPVLSVCPSVRLTFDLGCHTPPWSARGQEQGGGQELPPVGRILLQVMSYEQTAVQPAGLPCNASWDAAAS